MVGPHYGWERAVVDSSGYLIDSYSREVLFAAVDAGEILFENDEITVSISAVDSVIDVPAGEFETAIFRKASRHSNGSSNHFYAHGVGLVKQVYISEDAKYEHNLVQYTVVK